MLCRSYFFHSLDNVNKRPTRGKEAQQNIEQTDAPDPEVNQGHQAQTMHVPLQYQIGYPMPATGGQYQGPNLRNEYAQHPNQFDYPVAGEQDQDLNLQNEHSQYQNQFEYPITEGQYQDSNLQNEHSQYQNQVGYHVTGGQYQGPNFRSEHLGYQNHADYTLPVARERFQDPNLRNEHVRYHYMVSSRSRIEDPSNRQVSPSRNNHFR